jgi:hypothetical protein
VSCARAVPLVECAPHVAAAECTAALSHAPSRRLPTPITAAPSGDPQMLSRHRLFSPPLTPSMSYRPCPRPVAPSTRTVAEEQSVLLQVPLQVCHRCCSCHHQGWCPAYCQRHGGYKRSSQLAPLALALSLPPGPQMRGHLAHSACEAAGPRRKPRLGGEAAHWFPRAEASIRSAHFFSILSRHNG